MALNNAIDLKSNGLVTFNNTTGVFSGSSLTNHALLLGGSSNAVTSLPLTNGQLAIGSTGSDPTAAALGSSNGVVVTNGAGSISIKNTRDVAKYVVSIDGIAGYTTIQSAIDQAIIDGVSSSSIGSIFVLSGAYTENLTIPDYIAISCINSTVSLVGSVTYNGTNISYISNIKSTSSSAPNFRNLGTGTINIDTCNITINAANPCLSISTSGTINSTNCTLTSLGSGYTFSVTNGICYLFGCNINGRGLANPIAGQGILQLNSCALVDMYITLDGMSNAFIYNCSNANSISVNPFVTFLNADAALSLFNSNITNSVSSGNVISGTGTMFYGYVSFVGDAVTIAPTVVQIVGNSYLGPLSFDGGTNVMDTDGQLAIGSTGTIPSISTLSVANGMNVLNGPGSITLSNLRDVSPYVVSSVIGQAQYSVIQDAIDQAVMDGASAAHPAVVYVFPGTYTEDVIFQAYISVACLSPQNGAIIEGHCFYLDNGNIGLTNITFQASGSDSALQIGCNGTIQLNNCKFLGDVGLALEVVTSSSIVNAYDLYIFASDDNPLVFSGGTCSFYNCIINGDTDFCTISGASSDLTFTGCTSTAHFSITEGSLKFYNSVLTSSFCIAQLTGTPAVFMFNCFVNSSDEDGYYVKGTGSFGFGCVNTFLGTAENIDPNIASVGGVTYLSRLSTSPSSSINGALSLGSSYQNPYNYDVFLTVYIQVTSATTASILCGVSELGVPDQQTIVSALTVSAVTIIPVPVYLPASYYVKISTSGTITATISGQQITPV